MLTLYYLTNQTLDKLNPSQCKPPDSLYFCSSTRIPPPTTRRCHPPPSPASSKPIPKQPHVACIHSLRHSPREAQTSGEPGMMTSTTECWGGQPVSGDQQGTWGTPPRTITTPSSTIATADRHTKKQSLHTPKKRNRYINKRINITTNACTVKTINPHTIKRISRHIIKKAGRHINTRTNISKKVSRHTTMIVTAAKLVTSKRVENITADLAIFRTRSPAYDAARREVKHTRIHLPGFAGLPATGPDQRLQLARPPARPQLIKI